MLIDSYLAIFLFFLVGLLLGSFGNVVIYRLPKMMEQEWRQDCADLMGLKDVASSSKISLSLPRSACVKCGHQIRWYENIPVLSYLFLGGKCSSCQVKISIRYPLVEVLTASVFAWCGHKFGFDWQAYAWCIFSYILIILTFIDWDTHLLPDDLNYILLWTGLLASLFSVIENSVFQAILGAFVAYSSLWIINQVFFLLTKKRGMGNGDFKLYAALGAWFGLGALIPLILTASIVGAFVGVFLKIFRREGFDSPIPFGPFLAGAGFLAMFYGGPAFQQILLFR